MSDQPLLFTPGPTFVPSQVQAEISKPMIHHRSSEFEKIFASLRNNLHLISQTDGECLVLTSSGTAAMEASVVSLFSAKEHVVIVDSGKFGNRWVEIAKRFGLNVDVIVKPWGTAVTADEILERITPSTRGVFVQACETSTGVYHPIERIGKALESYSDILFVVDAITAFGIYPLSQRTHRIDVMLAASQKALMCPPGLSIVGLSKRAIARLNEPSSLYLSLSHELKSQVNNRTAFTPAISLVRGLEKSTSMILNEGRQDVFKRHQKLQSITRGYFRALGFQLLANDEDASAGITAIHVIQGLDVGKWLEQLRVQNNLWLAAGQGQFATKIFRMAHMGYCDERALKQALEIIGKSLKKILKIDQATDFLKKI
ncbi:MAG: alanine--glyoxylate aminotransferase family protein [Proteobacteria bacterium]|jgi:aspartate aminotransferase-like enzyme|nr:alanine--glyoxylate aminotransferase family protein [Pseudomonadota bacterium]